MRARSWISGTSGGDPVPVAQNDFLHRPWLGEGASEELFLDRPVPDTGAAWPGRSQVSLSRLSTCLLAAFWGVERSP